jgi:hypothetical protein
MALTQPLAVEPLRWGFARGCRAVLCLQPFFQILFKNPFARNFQLFSRPFRTRKEPSAKLNFNSQTPAKFLINFTFYF